MHEALTLGLVLAAGVLLGAFFYGGLWWTVQKGAVSEQPALWFLGSLLLRMGFVLSGIYLVSDRRWERLVTCLLGFVIGRIVVTWLTRPAVELRTRSVEEVSHASQS